MEKNIAATQSHLNIVDIQDHFVILREGKACVVLQTTAVNFDLLSEREQDAMITAYAGLLNSLSFPIQVLIRSKRMDISSYLEKLDSAATKQVNPYLKQKIQSYREYVKQLISKNNVLDKRFYIIISHKDTVLTSQSSGFLGLFGKKQVRFDKSGLLERARNHLEPKIDHLIKQLSRIGVKVRVLNTQELVELYYDIYNPQTSHEERLRTDVREYLSPLVEPAVGTARTTSAPPKSEETQPAKEKEHETT